MAIPDLGEQADLSQQRGDRNGQGPGKGLGKAAKQLKSAGLALLGEMVCGSMAEALVCVEDDSLCGASYSQSCGERVNHCNGYRDWLWDMQGGGGGRIDLVIPRLSQGQATTLRGCLTLVGALSGFWCRW